MQGRHICRQIVRSGTAAAAANYGEARDAGSQSDFVHKPKIVLKHLNETPEVITESSLLSPENTTAIGAENRELGRIIAASIKTAAYGFGLNPVIGRLAKYIRHRTTAN